ncbi:UNVERIFIED_CONTAM: Heme oxygenase 2 [Siphonaria sp. JEL0065]|nr:Heme oxygenase 2 [Siphonaria sp. JEL0065]
MNTTDSATTITPSSFFTALVIGITSFAVFVAVSQKLPFKLGQKKEAPSSAAPTAVSTEVLPFSAIVKEETKGLHRDAESCQLIKLIFSARMTWPLYLKYLIALYPVYRELEAAMDKNKDHPVINRFYFPTELHRSKRMENDIRFLLQTDNEDVVQEALATRSLAVQEYCDRIRYISNTDPSLLVAHTYSRYLGDLSGGQMIKKRIAKSLELETGAGLEFYEFPDIKDHNVFKVQYRALMDSLIINESLKGYVDKNAFVEEAKKSFVYNIAVFDEAYA